jgi:hypothetical protein
MSKLVSYGVSEDRDYQYLVKSRIGRAADFMFGVSRRNIYWSNYEPRNFGDWITPYLFTKVTGLVPIYQRPSRRVETLLGAGSILRHIKHADTATVWGSGVITAHDAFERPKEILAVRGKWTQRILRERGISCPISTGDPGSLLSSIYKPNITTKKYRLGLIPHFDELDLVRREWGGATDEIVIIDPAMPVESVVDSISSCEFTISSSLHGIIVSHAYGVRSGWVRFSPRQKKLIGGDDIKYLDYFSNFGLDEGCDAVYGCLPKDYSVEGLIRIAADSVVPDIGGCVDRLKKSCPFGL